MILMILFRLSMMPMYLKVDSVPCARKIHFASHEGQQCTEHAATTESSIELLSIIEAAIATARLI